MRRVASTVVFALAGLALFSLLFSLLALNGLWPVLAPGALHNTDLLAGFLGAIALLVLLLRNDAAGAQGPSGPIESEQDAQGEGLEQAARAEGSGG